MLKNIKEILARSKNAGLVILSVIAAFVVLTLVMRLLERPTKAVCTYILQSDETLKKQIERVVPVEASIVKKDKMRKRVTSVGRLRANKSVTLRSEMAGRIKKLSFEQGTSVKKDEILIEFESADIRAKLSQAQAELKVQELDFGRIEKLFKQKVESQKRLDEITGKMSIAKARVEEAQAALDKTIIKAPFDGTIGIIDFSEGAYVQASQELVTVVDSSPIKVDFKIPERYVNDVGPGQVLELKVAAFENREFTGVLEAVDSKIEEKSHSLLLRGSLLNEDGILKPGLFANINLVIGEQGDVILIEETAVERQGDKEFVYLVDKGRARQALVVTGHRENGRVEIKAGLAKGQMVVTVGQIRIGNGTKVKISNMPDPTMDDGSDQTIPGENVTTETKNVAEKNKQKK